MTTFVTINTPDVELVINTAEIRYLIVRDNEYFVELLADETYKISDAEYRRVKKILTMSFRSGRTFRSRTEDKE